MQPFSLYYPVKPHIVNQKWGVYRPEVYRQFDFEYHNGMDLGLKHGQPIFVPLLSYVVRIGYEAKGAGHFIVLRSELAYTFPDEITAFVEVTFMHMEKVTTTAGKALMVGQRVGPGDNTGFSTGPHTHMRCRRVKELPGRFVEIDINRANNSFDQEPHFNGIYAEDVAPKFRHTFTQDITFGEGSAEVIALQTALQLQGTFPATQDITGFYGEVTRKAVKAFQQKYQVASLYELLVVNGKRVGLKTRKKLNDLYV